MILYIDDVVEAWYKIALDKKNFNKIYNLGSGSKVTLTQLFKIISDTINKKLNIKVRKGTPGDFLGCYSDISKIKKDLKFFPKTNLKIGLKKFDIWLDKNKK